MRRKTLVLVALILLTGLFSAGYGETPSKEVYRDDNVRIAIIEKNVVYWDYSRQGYRPVNIVSWPAAKAPDLETAAPMPYAVRLKLRLSMTEPDDKMTLLIHESNYLNGAVTPGHAKKIQGIKLYDNWGKWYPLIKVAPMMAKIDGNHPQTITVEFKHFPPPTTKVMKLLIDPFVLGNQLPVKITFPSATLGKSY